MPGMPRKWGKTVPLCALSCAFTKGLVFYVKFRYLVAANLFCFLFLQLLGNDVLFFGDSSYLHELASLCQFVLQNLVDAIQQEPSMVTTTFNMGFPFCPSIFVVLICGSD